MTDTICLATLQPLAPGEVGFGYRNAGLKHVFGTTDICLPLGFDRREFFTRSAANAKGLSISGVQQKLSLRLDTKTRRLVQTAQGGGYILKPSPEGYPNAAENEHAAMLASKVMGIDTAACSLVRFADGELAYLTRRFDRLVDGGKVHQEDLLQISGHSPSDKYGMSYEEAGEFVHRATKGKLAVIRDLFRRVMLSYVIGNNDLHFKNLSLQRLHDTPEGYFDQLTPTYDVLFVQAFSGSKEGQFLACDLLTDQSGEGEVFVPESQAYGFFTGHDFLELGRRYGLPAKVIKKAIIEQIRKKNALLAVIDKSFMPEPMKHEASILVTQRCGALEIGVER
jgi:serine/threonine-protein kinase HipA